MIKFSNKKIIEIGTYLLVFLLPWQTRWIIETGKINGGVSEYLTYSLYATDILLVALLILIFAQRPGNIFQTGNFKSIYPFMDLKNVAFLFFASIIPLSIFWSENRLLAIERVGWLVFAITLAWLIAAVKDRTKIMLSFIAGLLLSAWLGIWQFFSQSAFANKWLGLASHQVFDPGVSYLEIYDKNHQLVRWLRSYGSFDHPNIFGFAMVIGLILVLCLICQGGNRKYQNVFSYLALVSFAGGLFASLSRSAFLGLFLALVVILFREKFSKKLLQPLAMLGFVFAALVLVYPEPMLARSDVNARLEQKSINERETYLRQGSGIIKKHILFGVGAGNYIEELKKEIPDNPAWAYQGVHDYFLLVWAELGIFAMLMAMISAAALGICAWKEGTFQFAIVVSFLPAMLLDHWLWDLHFGWLMMGFAVGILIYKSKSNENRN